MHKYSKLLRMNLASPMGKVLNFVVLGLHFCFTCSFGTIFFLLVGPGRGNTAVNTLKNAKGVEFPPQIARTLE